MQCPKCGYNNLEDALFCNLCHEVFSKGPSKRPEISHEEERYMIMHKHREVGERWKGWLALDVWVSIIVIVSVAFWAMNTIRKQGSNPPAKTKIAKSKIDHKINPYVIQTQPTYTLPIKRKTSHFVIHSNDEFLADEIATKVEDYYNIPIDLGFGESEFWKKGKVHIYIYDTPQEYANVTGKALWSSGYSEFKTRRIYSYKDAEELIDAVIPHELTHLIFADFINFSSNYPKWLAEGLAMYEETKYSKKHIATYQNILNQIKQGKYMSVDQLTKIDISEETKIELIHLWYVESMSIVTYLIDVYGKENLYIFCKNLREGRRLNEAFENAYSQYIKSLPELTDRWLNYIKTNKQSWEG